MTEYTVEDILNVITVNEDGMTRVWYDKYEVKKEIDMRDGIMKRQKKVLGRKDEEIEMLRKGVRKLNKKKTKKLKGE